MSAPRALYVRFPIGRSFGGAGSSDLQREILKELLQFAVHGEPESIDFLIGGSGIEVEK
ncbi:hypothetical protein [Ammoniphilus sp. 3BR4]|uniref:hypothetical protein n=1 Tax=Ammoniphilus sp. 3BR4 TaxID=3158265 RepID=UPI0034668075